MDSNSTKKYTMMMYFHTKLSDYVLFKELLVTEVGEMIGACVVVFIVGLLYEGLKVLREKHLTAATRGSSAYLLSRNNGEPYSPRGMTMLSGPHLIQTLFHTVQVTVAYMIMLVYMTYSVWLCLAVVLGSTLGYFLFGWRRSSMVDISEHCH